MADLTKTIVISVKDDQLRRATDRLFKSLDRIEKKLDVISGKGFNKLATGATVAAEKISKASKQIDTFGKIVNRTDGLTRKAALGAGILAVGIDGFTKSIRPALASIPLLGKGLTEVTAGFAAHTAAVSAAAGAFPPLTAAVAAATGAYLLFGKDGIGNAVKWLNVKRKRIAEAITGLEKLEHQVQLTTKGMIELAKAQGLQGLQKLLASATTEQAKLLSSSSSYLAQVQRVREIESEVNKELIARQKILDDIIRKEGFKAGTPSQIAKAGGDSGLVGLNKLLADAEAIRNRMLSTDEKYLEQSVAIRNIQIAINKEQAARDKIAKSILATETKTAAVKTRSASAGGKGLGSFIRSNMGDEVGRRGLGIAATAGTAKGLSDGFGAWNAAAHTKIGAAMGMTTAKANALQAVLMKLGAVMTAHPAIAAAVAAAYMAFGLKGFGAAERGAAKLTQTVYGLGGALGGIAKPQIKSAVLELTGTFLEMNGDIKMTTESARRLNEELSRQKSLRGSLLRNRARSRAGRAGSGFAEWSSGAGEYNPYALETSKAGGMWRAGVQGPQLPMSIGGKSLDAIHKSILRHEKKLAKISGHTKQTASAVTATQKTVTANPAMYAPGTAGPARAPGAWQSMFSMGRGGASKGVFGMPMGQRMSGMASSGLIGGGFPLLFGQGGASALGGGIGGVAGGALGGGFGFGLSVVGTVIGTKIQEAIDFRKAVDDLNVSIEATGGTSTFTAAQVRKFGRDLGLTKDEALEALKAFQQFEASARIALRTVFGSESIFNTLAGLKDNATLLSSMSGLTKELSLEQSKVVLEVLKTQGLRAAENKILDLTINKNKKLIEQEAEKKKFFDLQKINPFRGEWQWRDPDNWLKGGRFQTMEELREGRGETAKAGFEDKRAEALERLELQKSFNEELERMAIIKAPEDELKKLLDPLRQLDSISTAVADSFGDAFKGIITGAMTAQEALANMFQRVADAFLDMAVQMIAAQVKMNLMGIFMPSIAPKKAPTSFTPSGGWDSFSSFGGGKADGGSVTGGTSYLVGEKGPEIFTPGKSGGIIPNKSLGGTSNVTINVDAGGSSMQGNAEQAGQLGRMLASAVQDEMARQKRPGGLLYR